MEYNVKQKHAKTSTLPSLRGIEGRDDRERIILQTASKNKVSLKKIKKNILTNEVDERHTRWTSGTFSDVNTGYETERSRIAGTNARNGSDNSKIFERKSSLIGTSANYLNDKNAYENRGESAPRLSIRAKTNSVHVKNISCSSLGSVFGKDFEGRPLNSQALHFQAMVDNNNQDLNKTFEKTFMKVNEEDYLDSMKGATPKIRLSVTEARALRNLEIMRNKRKLIINEDEVIELFEGRSDKIYIMKHGFCYFRIKAKEQHAPLRISIKKICDNPMVKVKVFVSSRIPKPSRFNCDAEFDGKGFRYFGSSSSTRSRTFSEEFIYLAIYSDENISLVMFVAFGEEDSYTMHQRKSEINAFLRQLKRDHKNKNLNGESQAEKEALKEQIKKILEERREKLMEMAHGENKVEMNKDIEKYKAESVETDRMRRKQKEMRQMIKVEMKAQQLFEEKIQQKQESAQKHDRLKAFKEYLLKEANSKRILYLKTKNWLRIIMLERMIRMLNDKLIIMREMNHRENFEKHIRFRLFFGMAKTLRRKGMGPVQRALCDSKQVLLSLISIRRKDLKRKAKEVLRNFLLQSAKQFEFVDRSEKFVKQVLRIQRQWFFLKKRKEVYKDVIRLHFTRNFARHYFEIKKEKIFSKTDFNLEQNLYLAHKASLNPQQKRRNNIVFPANDMLLQTQIIESFMAENLRKWRGKMDEYREKLLYLKNNEESKKAISILKRFWLAVQKDEDDEIELSNNNDQEDEFNLMKPPILYIKPKDSDIKLLVEQYLQLKKIL